MRHYLNLNLKFFMAGAFLLALFFLPANFNTLSARVVGVHVGWAGDRGYWVGRGDWDGNRWGPAYYRGYGLAHPGYYDRAVYPYYGTPHPYSDYYYDNRSGVYFNVR